MCRACGASRRTRGTRGKTFTVIASRCRAHHESAGTARVLLFVGCSPMQRVLLMSDITRSAGVAADPMQEAHRLFHRLWSKAYDAPGYDKREWLRFEELLRQVGLRI